MKRYLKLLFGIAFSLLISFQAFASSFSDNSENAEGMGEIVGIESLIFFDDLPGTFYVYFGRPTCPDCVEFEKHLNAYLENNRWTIYYFNTAYWKDDPRFDNILNKYNVYGVPSLVEIVNGTYSAEYQFHPDDSGDEIQKQLKIFFKNPGMELFAITSKSNYPIQFDSNLHTFTFLITGINLLYLFLKRKDLIKRKDSSFVAMLIMNSSLLFALHCAIAAFGFSFAMRYEAEPDLKLWACVGRYTWLTITPVLYFIILLLGAKILKDIKCNKDCADT